MTRKDHQLIAAALASMKPADPPKVYSDWSESQHDSHYNLVRHWKYQCKTFGYMLASENPRFDRVKFLAACGITE